MKVKNILLWLVVILFLLSSLDAAMAYQQLYYVKIQELYENPIRYDGTMVGIKGEVVGDILASQGSYWINVNDDSYSLKSIAEGERPRGQNTGAGVVITEEMKKLIKHTGSYHQKGDYVEIIGEYHASCDEHNGEADIHAVELRVLKQGYPIEHSLNIPLAVVSIGLLGVVIVGYLLRYYFITRPGFRRSKQI